MPTAANAAPRILSLDAHSGMARGDPPVHWFAKLKEIPLMPTLRELRADCLLTIRELAQQAGVAPSSIFLIEAGA
jgi:hypothetical protein